MTQTKTLKGPSAGLRTGPEMAQPLTPSNWSAPFICPPLWPETIQALKEVPRSGTLVFTTSDGHSWIRTTTRNDNGDPKYICDNRISTKFSRLMKKVRIQAPKGTGFYTLRRTAATMAARSGDPFAVQRLLGHVDLTMATRYVQDVSEQTDRVIESSRKYFIGKEKVA